MIFDGKAFAQEIEEQINYKVRNLVSKPHVVSVLVGDDPASVLYTKLKKAAAERVGIHFDIVKLQDGSTQEDVIRQIQKLGMQPLTDGIMIQLPIPGMTKVQQNEVLKTIPIDKDIDGLRWQESGVMPATVKAVMSILSKIEVNGSADLPAGRQGSQLWAQRFVIMGSEGSVGKPLVHFLRAHGVQHVGGVDIGETDPARIILAGDVIISCVGKPGIVTRDMVRPGVVAIDVGISQRNGTVVGDMTQGVYDTASVAVPVPGGVGPVTIASLMGNIYDVSILRRRYVRPSQA